MHALGFGLQCLGFEFQGYCVIGLQADRVLWVLWVPGVQVSTISASDPLSCRLCSITGCSLARFLARVAVRCGATLCITAQCIAPAVHREEFRGIASCHFTPFYITYVRTRASRAASPSFFSSSPFFAK